MPPSARPARSVGRSNLIVSTSPGPGCRSRLVGSLTVNDESSGGYGSSSTRSATPIVTGPNESVPPWKRGSIERRLADAGMLSTVSNGRGASDGGGSMTVIRKVDASDQPPE